MSQLYYFLRKRNYKNKNKYNTGCTICLEDFEKKEEIFTLLSCKKHYFHQDCFSKWLKVNQSCPLCRAEPILYAKKKFLFFFVRYKKVEQCNYIHYSEYSSEVNSDSEEYSQTEEEVFEDAYSEDGYEINITIL